MNKRYCYWSVADGPYAAVMQDCINSARACGVFKEFHVLTDRPLEGCECYDCFQFDKAHGLFKLHFLKVGMTRLNFDYFIWLDADTLFYRNPLDPLAALGHSPVHVPLESKLDAAAALSSGPDRNVPIAALRDLFVANGVGDPYLSGSAFWIVHRDVIEPVYNLAFDFWHKGKERGPVLDVAHALGYAMQILCADTERHRVSNHPELWRDRNGADTIDGRKAAIEHVPKTNVCV